MQTLKGLSFSRSCRGYTLIETAIVLAIGGMLFMAFAGALNIYLQTQKNLLTQNNLTLISGALQSYLIQNGSYPCPAPMNTLRGAAGYGRASQCDPTQTAGVNPSNPYVVIAPGTTVGGLTEYTSDRATCNGPPTNPCAGGHFNPGTALTGNSALARSGMVPFRNIGLTEEQVMDGWDNRIEYMVMEDLAVPATYNRTLGGIDVVDGNNTSLTMASTVQIPGQAPVNTWLGSVQFALVSFGPDGAGATAHYGGGGAPCSTGTLDAINCTVPSTINGIANAAVLRYSPLAPQPGINHFDDAVIFYTSSQSPLWKVSDNSGFNIADIINAGNGLNTGKVGIGVPSPGTTANDAALQVSGGAHASGNINAQYICPQGTLQNFPCIASDNFMPAPGTGYGSTGTGPTSAGGTFGCPSGQYATGITNGQINCTAAPSSTCPAGEILNGLGNNGQLQCVTVVGCPPKTTTLCNPDPNVPAISPITIPAGVQGQIWTSPVDGLSYQKQETCGAGGTWQYTGSWGTCACNVGTTTSTRPCQGYSGAPVFGIGINWGGNVITTNVTTYIGGVCNTVSTPDATACVCNSGTINGTSICPYGYSGGGTTTQSWTCSGNPAVPGTLGGVVVDNSGCSCNAGATQSYTQYCSAALGAGWSGSWTQTSTETCPGGVPSWSTPSPTTPPGGACTCSAVQQVISPPSGCPSPEVGSITYYQVWDCVANNWGTPQVLSNNCGLSTHTWQNPTGQTGPFGTASGPGLNSNCSDAQVGTITTCNSPTGANYWYYNCTCE
jgi:prepilin-type N-terminal cleavage/methylation domain-containing protein